MVALLEVALLEPARAVDGKPDECGLASVYSTVSEETASGDDTRPEDFTAAHRSLPFGTLIHVSNQEKRAHRGGADHRSWRLKAMAEDEPSSGSLRSFARTG